MEYLVSAGLSAPWALLQVCVRSARLGVLLWEHGDCFAHLRCLRMAAACRVKPKQDAKTDGMRGGQAYCASIKNKVGGCGCPCLPARSILRAYRAAVITPAPV